MNLKDHRQYLKETLVKIRESLPDDLRQKIESHMRDIVDSDRQLREQLREMPQELERAWAEVKRLRASMDEQATQSANEVGSLRRELGAIHRRDAAEADRPLDERLKNLSGRLAEHFRRCNGPVEYGEAMLRVYVWYLAQLTDHVSQMAANRSVPEHVEDIRRVSLNHLGERLSLLVNDHMRRLGINDFDVRWHPVNE